MMDTLKALADAHTKLGLANDMTDKSFEAGNPDLADDLRARGWVAFPLSDAHVAELEELAGFSFPPLLRGLFQTKGAMPSFDVDVFGVQHWAGESALEKNRKVQAARAEHDWQLPKFVAISSDEDFRAVTEDGRVVRVCGNEGNIDVDHGPLDGWLQRYTGTVLAMIDDPDGDHFEDPEATYP